MNEPTAPLMVAPAVPADREWIVDCQLAMAWETESLRLDVATVRQGVAAALEDDRKGVYWIARREGRPVGVLMVTREWSDWRNGDFWWIQSVYVDPAQRGTGVFTALYETLRRQVQDQGAACGLRLYVEKENDRARRTYQRLGMQETHYRMMQWTRP